MNIEDMNSLDFATPEWPVKFIGDVEMTPFEQTEFICNISNGFLRLIQKGYQSKKGQIEFEDIIDGNDLYRIVKHGYKSRYYTVEKYHLDK